MFAILNRSKSLRGGGHHGGSSAAAAGSGTTTSVGGPASAATNTSSTRTNHVNGQGKTHGPNAPLSLLSTMVVPSAAPAFVIPTAASMSEFAETSDSTAYFSSSASTTSSSSLSSSSNTAASSISASSIEPGLVSKPTLQTSTVLGLVEEKTTTLSSPGIDGKRECPYVNRPLPPPPPPKTPSTMPSSQPSTSTSTGTVPKRPPPPTALVPPRRPANPNRRISRDDMFLGTQTKNYAAFDKRISRDDLYVGTRPPAARSAAFHIPLRPQPATVEEGSDLSTRPPPAAWPARRATPESLMSGEIQIGMALGSPVRASPPEPMSFRQQQRTQNERFQQVEPATYASWQPLAIPHSHGSITSSDPSTEMPLQRSKTTRQKLFGIFGSKRHHDPVKSTLPSSSSSYSLDASESSSIMMTSAVPTSGLAANTSAAAERPATRSGNRKHQPIVVQIVPEPAIATNIMAGSSAPPPLAPTPSVKEGRSMRPFLRSKASEPAMRKRLEISNPIPLALGNGTLSNFNDSNTIPAGSGNLSNPGYPSNPSNRNNLINRGNPNYLMPPPMLGASPYLDVEIPESRMERYSVMFGGLIAGGPSWQPASSLLARRQATLDKLKTINDRIQQDDLERDRAAAAAADALVGINGLPSAGLQRRATSPHVTRSPGFSLFPNREPNVGSALGNTGHLSPRLRSNTSPAATRSPAPSEFNFPRPPGMTTALPPVHSSQRHVNPLRGNPTPESRRAPPAPQRMPAASMPAAATAPAPALAPPPAQKARPVVRFDPTQSSLILDSPTEMDYPDEPTWQDKTQQSKSFRPVIQSPQWQMISPPGSISSAGSSSASASSKLLRGGKATGPGATTPSPSSTASLDFDGEETDPTLKSAVEISIARQISISRQQRQLLRPLKTNNLAQPAASATAAATTPQSSASTSSPARSATLKLNRNERLQETKMATPKLVVAPPTANTQANNYSYSNGSGNGNNSSRNLPPPMSGLSPQQQQMQQQQRMRYLSPRSNANANSNLQAYQLAQNRKSERVVLEAI